MRTRTSDTRFQGHRGRNRMADRPDSGRKSRVRWLVLEGLETRRLLATTIPAAAATGPAMDLSSLSSVPAGSNANSPAVVIDPYDSQDIFAVWSVDLSTATAPNPYAPTTALVLGAYSDNGGTTWHGLGDAVAPPLPDPLTVNATPPTDYTQVTDSSVGFDGNGNVYVLSLQTSGASDGALDLTKFSFPESAGSAPSLVSNNIVYQWVTGSDAATDPVVAVDASNPGKTGVGDAFANNVYIAWASIDQPLANPAQYTDSTGFNPNCVELVVGTPAGESNMSFSGVTTVNADGNFGPQDDSHPQLVINQNDGGQVTVAWDDFGTGASATPPFDELNSELVQPGDAFGFAGDTGPILPGTTTQPTTTPFTDQVEFSAGTNTSLFNDLTVTVDLVDQESVQNLSLVLFAPNGNSITLVANQNNAAGTADVSEGLPSGNAIGVYGFTTGATGTPGIDVGTTFDDNATRDIFDPTTANPVANGNTATDYIGYFRPEFGSLKSFLASLGGDLDGPWTLDVTDFTATTETGVADQGQLQDFSLQFSKGMGTGAQNLIATTLVTGAIGNTYALNPPSSPNVGVGPGLVLAIDNTLGPDSPFAGQIYAAYVTYDPAQDVNGHVNSPDNTDISLSVFNPTTGEWSSEGVVNDDDADTDGYSSAGGPEGDTFGRTQFQPEIAVDQATGTVVLSWRDARNDAADARVATYITASTDGGQTFNAQTYANPNQTAIDAITGQVDVLGPEPDNESTGNPQADVAFGYGDQMGLAVFDGQVYPVWAGNFDQATTVNGTIVGNSLQIYYQPMVIASGPRITTSTMGPIPLAEAESGSVGISVTFDRPIVPSTFVIGDVEVFYHDTTHGNTYVPLKVLSITEDSTSQYTIFFNPTPPGANPATFNYTGTYSYLIAPSYDGTNISSPVSAYVNGSVRYLDPDDQSADGGSTPVNAITTPYTGTTPGDVYAVPAPAIPPPTESVPNPVIGFNGAESILQPTYGLNPNTLPIIVPGPQVLSTSVPGGDSGAGNLVTNGTVSSLETTFDRPMEVASFTPTQVLSIMGPAGQINAPQYFPSDVQTGQTISGALNSTLTIPSYGGTFTIADITVSMTVAFTPDSDLTAVLISPSGTEVVLFSGVGASGTNFIDTVFDDSATTPITSGSSPFTGTYQPTGSLASLDGETVDKNTDGLWVPGVWTLQISSSSASATGTLDNWSLNITPQISVTPVKAVNGTATQFTIGFPQQELSGTYTVQIAPSIVDTFGDGLDTNQVAGLAVIRDTGQNNPTTTVNYAASDLNAAIPAPAAGGSVSSSITVPDNFIIQGDTTTSGLSGLRVQVDLTYPDDPALTGTLYHYDADGNLLGSVPLFVNAGNGPVTANFTDTIFDDNGTTPISEGDAPFSATFSPQESIASAFAGQSAQGTWTLVIQVAQSATSGAGTFNSWSLSFQDPLPTSGLGVPGSDDFTASFRIFTLSQVDALSSQEWTAVGPASIGGGSSGNSGAPDPSGRVTGLAIDPSDPSGNTVYAGGASGGIWKTTDFLTTNPAGPTWIPLTDFGPTNGVNIGGIAVFGRNDNPNDSIIVAATGEGDTGTAGAGFLVSMNGGATWVLDDSSDNVDANGNELPIASASRDRVFVGDSAFAVTVDPTPTASGGVIIYAALSGPTGGIWRSENTGATWQLMLSGQATSVIADPSSGQVLDPSTNTYVQGNLQVIYASIRGTGVFMSPNQGQVWNQMLGDIGNPLIFDDQYAVPPNVNPVNGLTPNGAEGRIELAVPNATGNIADDAVYAGWLYAIVATPAGALDGIFVTKDYGQNWTEVNIPTEPNEGYQSTPAIPSNDVTLSNYSVIGTPLFPQGNYNIAIAVDPTDPSVLYIGGTADGNQAALIRINLTDIWDAHSLVPYSYFSNDGGLLNLASTGPATVASLTVVNQPTEPNYESTAYLNLIRNPEDPFVGSATLDVYNYASFTNNGAGVEWIPLSSGGTDYHRMVTMIDPTTGLPRIIFGDDQGIWSLLDNNGTPDYQIGNSDELPGNSRNGNLQITQFYYGAAQPSNAAALIAGAMYYGSAQDNGGPMSSPTILSTGDIVWNGPGGDASGVATDQQGNGTLYQYFWPCCGGNDTDFFQVNGTGRTNGLLQASDGDPTPDPQWPYKGGANFAVNPVNGQDIVISSAVGRIFATTNEGVTWFDVGDPPVFNSPGTFSVALAYGAPDPSAPGGVGDLGNFIYVGTAKGQIYVTQDGGGSGAGNNWLNISLGLDGSAVQSIITDPTRGSHDAYAVTSTGVFYLPDSILLGNNPADTVYEWINITANLKTLAYSIFGQNYNPATDPNSEPYDQAVSLSAIVADWRYDIPNSTKYANGPSYHPVLYVSANSGVYQSVNGGQTWTLFPDTTYGAVVNGGYLPHVSVTSMSLSLGDIDPNTGMPDLFGPDNPNASDRTDQADADPDTLMAATYGQGEFAINLAPLIINNAVALSPAPTTSDSNDIPIVTGPFTINGTSEITGFGNATWVTVEDVTNPADPIFVGGFNPSDPVLTPNATNSTNGQGNFAIPVDPDDLYTTDGVHTYEIFATDNAGSVGNIVKYTFDFQEHANFVFEVEPVSTAVAGTNFAALPNKIVVDADDTAGGLITTYNGVVTISLEGSGGTLLGTLTATAVNGVATFSNLEIDQTGTYQLEANGAIPAPSTTTPAESTSITITPAAPAQLVWVTQPPAKVTEGFGFGAVLDLEDQYGNLETDLASNTVSVSVSLDLSGSPDTTDLGGTDTVYVEGSTGADPGSVVFSNIVINALGSPFTLIASSDGTGSVPFYSAPSTSIDVIEPQIVVTSQPTSPVTAGNGFPLTADVETYTGAIDTEVTGPNTLNLTLVSGPLDATIGGTTSAVASAGVATFNNVILDKAGAYVLQVSGSKLLPGDTSTITVVAQATVAGLVFEIEPPSSVQAGAGFGFTVGSVDQFGNPNSLTGSVSVAISNNPGGSNLGGTTIVTASGGVAVFSGLTLNKVGTDYTLLVSNSTLSVTSTGINVTPAPASQFVIAAGGEPPAQVNAGQTFSMVVDAIDPFGNLDTNFTGSVTIAQPSNITGKTTVSAVAGVATFSNLMIDTVGKYNLEATDSPLTAVTSTSVTVIAAKPAQVVWTAEPPSQVIHNMDFGATVQVEDQFGNLETNYDGNVTIALLSNPGNAVLGGVTTIPASGGVAAFTVLTIDVIDNNYTLRASSGGFNTPASTPIDVLPIPAASLVVTTQPSTVQVYEPFGLTITALDANGNLDPDFNGSVTVALAPTSASNILGGTTTVNAIDGVATFSKLTLAQVGNMTLQLSTSSGLTVDTSSISVTAGPASQLILVTQPQTSLTAGTTIDFEVEAEDQYGNLATGFNGTLTASLAGNGGKGTLDGTLTEQAVAGIAEFNSLSVDQAGSGYTVTVTSITPATSVVTDAFSITPAAPAELVIASQAPTTVTAGAAFGLTVDIDDVYGNVATSFVGTVNIALSLNQASAPLYGNQSITASDGVVNFAGLAIDAAASNYTIVASTNGLNSAISNPFDVVPATATQLVVTVPTPLSMAAGSFFGMAVAAEDNYGNIVTDYTGNIAVALKNNPGNATLLGGPFVIAPTGGVANFSPHLIIDTAASGYTLEATSDGLTSVISRPITVTPAAATQLVIQTQPPSALASASTTFGLIVAVEDPYGNINTNYGGQIHVATPPGSGATLGGTTTVTTSAGLGIFTGLTLSGESTPISLLVTSPGLTGITSTSPVGAAVPSIEFATSSVSVAENAGSASLQIVRSGLVSTAVTVDVSTTAVTAVAGVNFTPINEMVSFAAGQTTQTITVPILNAGTLAQQAIVNVVLSSPSPGAILGSQSTEKLAIVNVGQGSGGTGGSGSAPLVNLEGVQVFKNKKHKVNEILISFSGGLNAAIADKLAEFELIKAGKHGSFTVKSAKPIKLLSAVYNSTNDTVALTPTKPFKLTKAALELVARGGTSGLEDSYGRPINGPVSGNAVAVINRSGTTVETVAVSLTAVDVLLEQDDLAAVTKARKS
jgi:large repetitive protein